MTHVFIVDDNTFKYHLEYMFAGTGASDRDATFLVNSKDKTTHSTTERMLVGMIADVSRIRIGDKIIFYVQGCAKFYGVFKAVSEPFYDKKEHNYLEAQLGKMLTFRIKIEPDTVFSDGISEHEYLDSLKNIKAPHQMCWSLIYRKLKGNRGCTMITDFEFDYLLFLLKQKNISALDGQDFTYNKNSNRIEATADRKAYLGDKTALNIKDRLINQALNGKAFEVHLQAYIMQSFDKKLLKPLICFNSDGRIWVGNEVSCGVGMQKIDVLAIRETPEAVDINIVELKCVAPSTEIVTKQLPWYIEWICDYIVPNYSKSVNLHPIILAKKAPLTSDFKQACENIVLPIKRDGLQLSPVAFIGFKVSETDISFEKIL